MKVPNPRRRKQITDIGASPETPVAYQD